LASYFATPRPTPEERTQALIDKVLRVAEALLRDHGADPQRRHIARWVLRDIKGSHRRGHRDDPWDDLDGLFDDDL
jgi:hypothetical protein